MQPSSLHTAWQATVVASVQLILCLTELQAQILVGGQVTDADRHQGVAAALVRVVNENNTEIQTAVTDKDGGYVLSLPGPAIYTLHIAAWGYHAEQVQDANIESDTVIAVMLNPSAPRQDGKFVRGVVVDHETNIPVSFASVLLIDSGEKARQITTTDDNGLYGLNVPKPGAYSLRIDAVEHLTMVTSPFEVIEGQTAAVEVRLTRQLATVLEGVTVTDIAPYTLPLHLREFEYRRMRGFGEFLTREEIEEKNPFRFSDALRLVPSVKVVRMPRDPERPYSNLNRNFTVLIKGMAKIYEDCVPGLFLDGMPLGPIDDAAEGGPDVLVFPSELEAIEVYRPSTVPAEFRTLDSMCGVIVVWTRRWR